MHFIKFLIFLLIIRSGPEESIIRQKIYDYDLNNRVVLIPWLQREKLIEFIGKCTLFVLPSLIEVFPVVVLEAMASSKPTIARSNIGTREIITHTYNGYLYSSDEELVKQLILLLSKPELRIKIGINARNTIEEKYSFMRLAEKYEKLFNNIER